MESTPIRRPLRRKLLFAASITAAAAILAAVAGEIVVRAQGGKPWRVEPWQIEVVPGGRLYCPDPELGLVYLPGRYTITVNGGLTFTVTHDAHGRRLTHPERPAADRPEIWIFGCSFTHGWTVNDAESYPWRLQEMLFGYEVVNFGTGGYGTVQGLIQFDQALGQGRRPALVIVAYAAFHDERNALLCTWRRAVVPHTRETLVVPYARLEGENLQLQRAPLEFTAFPCARVSALVHRLEQWIDTREAERVGSHAVSRRLVREFIARARANDIPLALVDIDGAPKSRKMVGFAREQGIPAATIAVNISQARFNNGPWDPHPNAEAHRLYAEKLRDFLVEQGLVEE